MRRGWEDPDLISVFKYLMVGESKEDRARFFSVTG